MLWRGAFPHPTPLLGDGPVCAWGGGGGGGDNHGLPLTLSDRFLLRTFNTANPISRVPEVPRLHTLFKVTFKCIILNNPENELSRY